MNEADLQKNFNEIQAQAHEMWSCSACKPVSTSESAAGPEILIQAMSSAALF